LNNQQLKQLEAQLWGAADNLRANSKLTAGEYKDPLLGLILLRYAQNKFEQKKLELEATVPIDPRSGEKEPVTKFQLKAANTLWLDEKARYDHLASLSEGANVNDAVNEAMRLIEHDNPELAGILPRNYQTLDPSLLHDLIRTFNDESVKNLSGDVFGRIYEFFLMKFSMTGAGAQEGGEFFTPPSLVQLIVNLIEPNVSDDKPEIIIHDPACGSGGMFVQTGHFIEEHGKQTNGLVVYGTEQKTNNVKLAKMNLAIHGIEGQIKESNSFYSDPHNLLGRCDFVMANPPFNVKQVDKSKDYVKTDKRLFDDIGIPKADNGNYLWIQYFYHYLNEKGRAGFVMASSATDAGNTEKAIRQKLIETGAVDCIVSVANNFFYTLSLPCHLWFLDKGKRAENKDKILMIDARNTYRKVNTTLNDFSKGHLINFAAMMRSFRGDDAAITNAIAAHQAILSELNEFLTEFANNLRSTCNHLIVTQPANSQDLSAYLTTPLFFAGFESPEAAEQAAVIFDNPVAQLSAAVESLLQKYSGEKAAVDVELKQATEIKDKAAIKSAKDEKKRLEVLIRELKLLVSAVGSYQQEAKENLADFKQAAADWQALLGYFPELRYQDVEGLCKVVDLQEVADNDWSLTPGRYVGYSVAVDEGFDYQARMAAIHAELAALHREANGLMEKIFVGADLSALCD
jgi:type I restriction enzyme M protein